MIKDKFKLESSQRAPNPAFTKEMSGHCWQDTLMAKKVNVDFQNLSLKKNHKNDDLCVAP